MVIVFLKRRCGLSKVKGHGGMPFSLGRDFGFRFIQWSRVIVFNNIRIGTLSASSSIRTCLLSPR